MLGVTSVLLLFCFVGVLFPRIIAERNQFYLGFGTVLLAIAWTPFIGFIGTPGSIILAVLQVVATVLLFLSAGGLSARGLTKDMLAGFEVIRRGESEKEIIIPFGEQKQRTTAVEEIGQPTERFNLDEETAASTPPPPAKKKDDDGPIPMD